MIKQYSEEFYLNNEANAMEEALKELGIGYTRKDNVISPKTSMTCTTINFSIEGKDIIDITYGQYKHILSLVNTYVAKRNG